ncbi:GxxExxY protein [methane-oxidizing endosymbiont of Gigantopelta aegis]|uniref:GxxExxY protein n=1 Tax=methane-oxidizing endosymbiont of Gigantopelta aegis TaxID=2794938 RepID=UPI0018DD8921|nr:GxxExxY protein [methane-oxidizing endosymbiont of Gigantopelta aegis]
MHAGKHRLNSISEKIIGYAFNVSNTLGAGFLEKVYQNALHLELLDAGFQVEKEKSITISYKGKVIGEYFADLLVNQQVIIEIKAVQSLNERHQAQLLNYLKATGLHLGILINFGTPKEALIYSVLPCSPWTGCQINSVSV